MKFREHRGGYSDSMATAVEVPNRTALVHHVHKLLEPYGVKVTASKLHIQPYGGVDSRNGWDTHIVTLDGYGVLGFTDGGADNGTD